ncbi:MAG: hypothetical protein HON53_18315 [Planctomycetaceae bacterium]|jgi:hypothetical protein|nr:hypothetical protein [Planctomycetaceae bacterium]MBT6154075.1 hypothetical protein [Planctomycetaceae bacterium]MBT6485131.1 hypothetical protein [Planctomycetaceae bacterium]MBT6495944.1 hypothetical protein [Planctomycetaceae bacterium]
MTGYTVHTGSSEKFTEGWDNIFSQSGAKKKSASAKKKSAKKKPAAKRKAGKKKKK